MAYDSSTHFANRNGRDTLCGRPLAAVMPKSDERVTCETCARAAMMGDPEKRPDVALVLAPEDAG